MTEGTLLYCNPFVFKNGATPKPKYFIVLANTDDGVMLASLPTSKDHVPADAEVVRGAVNIPERGVNAYVIGRHCGHGRWPTFLRLGIMSKLLLRSAYRNVRLEVRGLSFVP